MSQEACQRLALLKRVRDEFRVRGQGGEHLRAEETGITRSKNTTLEITATQK